MRRRRCRRRPPSAAGAAGRRRRRRRADSRPATSRLHRRCCAASMGGGVAIQLPVLVDQHRTGGAEGGEHRADAAVDQPRGRRTPPALDRLGRLRLPVPAASSPRTPASSSAFGLIRSGAARSNAATSAASGPSEVSTATRHVDSARAARPRRRTSRRAHRAAAIRTAPPTLRSRRARPPTGSARRGRSRRARRPAR